MTTLIDLPNDMLRIICAREMMSYESVAHCIAHGFVFRRTCRALRDTVNFHAKDYYSLAGVPISDGYGWFWCKKPWHQVADMIFELARLSFVDKRALLLMNQYRHTENWSTSDLSLPQQYPRPWHQLWVKRSIQKSSKITIPLWIIEGLCMGGHVIPSELLVSFQHNDNVWTRCLMVLAARYDIPELYFYRKHPACAMHGPWRGYGIWVSEYYYDTYNICEMDINPKELLYVFGATKCFDWLLESFAGDPALQHKQKVIMRANLRRMQRKLYHDWDNYSKDKMTCLSRHLDARYKDGLKRKRQEANTAKKQTKYPRRE